MKPFFPRRRLHASEFLLIPEAFFNLTVSWINVNFRPSKSYLLPPDSSAFRPVSKEKKEKSFEIAAVVNGLSTRTVWRSTCLIKALATHKMLQKRDIEHKLHFGVTQSAENKLEAHAWLSVENEVIVGGENHEAFEEIMGKE